MTLVLTQLNEHGIAMAADSAVTTIINLPNGTQDYHVRHGANKLQRIPHLQAGISCWGTGVINGIPTDDWIDQFINLNANATPDLESFALKLAHDLNNIFPPGSDNSGFHLAGYTNSKIGIHPAFYHIHNGISDHFPGINPDIFNPNLDSPPKIYIPGQFNITRNGDYQLYAQFFNYLSAFITNIASYQPLAGIKIPSPENLYTHAKLLRLQIQFVAGLYDVSNLVPGIGGPITILGISPTGIDFFETL